MFLKFADHFDGMEFDSLEEYYSEVLRFSAEVEEELGRAERWAKQNNSEVFEQLNVTIKGVYPEEEEDDEYDTERASEQNAVSVSV